MSQTNNPITTDAVAPVTGLELLPHPARGSSFHLPMLLLPKERRHGLFSLYAVCRALDDAVDDAPSTKAATASLDLWRDELDAIFQGKTPQTPLGMEFQHLHLTYGFIADDAYAMLSALRMDSEGKMRYPAEAELETYCYGVAGCVGLMSMRIFNCDGPHARPFAIALGHALQLTNIIRDITADARAGRVYLPMDAFRKTPPSTQDIIKDPAIIRTASTYLGRKAKDYYQQAAIHAAQLPARKITPAMAMGNIYACYWRQLKARQWEPPMDGDLALTFGEKLTAGYDTFRQLMGRTHHFRL